MSIFPQMIMPGGATLASSPDLIGVAGTAQYSYSDTANTPTSLGDGDVIIAFGWYPSVTILTPSGWTLIRREGSGGNYAAFKYVVSGGSYPSTVTLTDADATATFAFRGLTGTVQSSADNDFSNPSSVTVSSAPAVVIALGIGGTGSSGSVTVPSGYTEILAADNGTYVLAAGWVLAETTGTYNPGAFSPDPFADSDSTITIAMS